MKLYMFRTVPLSIIGVFHCTHSNGMSYRFADSSQAVSKPVWHIPLLCVQWKTPDDGQRNCPKHVGFPPKINFEKLVHLSGSIIRNLSRCTVTRTSRQSTLNNNIRSATVTSSAYGLPLFNPVWQTVSDAWPASLSTSHNFTTCQWNFLIHIYMLTVFHLINNFMFLCALFDQKVLM